jgi:hypothetical protein
LREAKYQWGGLTNAQRWHYHAYDYAFLRVRHGLDNRSYPLDPDGKWFHAQLVEAAERIYQPRAKPYSAPADTVCDPELAEHFRRQDAERDALRRRVQVHGEREIGGEPTPEMLAFMACCVRQAEENGRIFVDRSIRAFAPNARMSAQAMRDVHRALGVTATPSYDDAEALRRGRIELGLEVEGDQLFTAEHTKPPV